jgi:hypothetical protein
MVVAAPARAEGPAQAELAFYRVSFGLLGQIGEITLATYPDATTGSKTVRTVGIGRGDLMGFGQIEKWIDAEYDPGAGSARKWVTRRRQGNTTVTDFMKQETPGQVALLRRRDGRPDLPDALSRQAGVLDPASFLMRLRAAPPEGATTFEVLDGRGLWRMELAAAELVAERTDLQRVSGKAIPISWDGNPEPERGTRSFALFLTRDAQRTPVSLVMPLAVGEVRVDLIALAHAAPPPKATGRTAVGAYLRWLTTIRSRPAPARAP